MDLFNRQTMGFLLRRTTANMAKRLNDKLGQFDTTLNHWVVLSCLWQKDGLPVMYIASQLQHIGGTLSDLLTRMEKRKLIKRRRDRKDRRVLRVFLTEEGSKLRELLPPLVHQAWYQAWEGLSASDLDRLSAHLDLMIQNCDPDYNVCLPEPSDDIPKSYQFILPPRSLGYKMKVLQLLMMRRFSDSAEKYNVTASHTLVLIRLWQNDGLPVTEIGQYLEQVGGSLTGVLERMEERGLIRREQDQKDRRSFRVWLTEEGESLIDVIPPIVNEVNKFACAGLSSDDILFVKKSLNSILERSEPSE
jgi:Transcriptional regulators